MADKDPNLKKEFEKKQRAFKALKQHAKRKLEKEKEKISKEKTEKLNNEDTRLEKNLKTIDKGEEEAIHKLEQREKTIHRRFEKREKEVRDNKDKKSRRIEREAVRAARIAEVMTEEEVDRARKDLISIKRRAYSRRRKIINTIQFAVVIYIFIFSVVVIKDVTLALSSGAIGTITGAVDTSASAFGAGWLTSTIAQSGSVVAILANTLVGSNIITFNTAFYILLGITLGNAITPVLASLVIRTKHHWHLRHGFELGLAYVIYSFFLVFIAFIIQFFTGFFTRTGEAVGAWAEEFGAFQEIPDLLAVITNPVKDLLQFDKLPLVVIFIIGIGLLIFSLGRVGKSMFVFLGGKRHTRALMEKYLSSYWKAFAIGLILTIIIPSASLLVTLMVPLAIAHIVKLRQAIPYIIGTSVGTFIDVFLASLANAQAYAVAGGVVLTLISAIGVMFIFRNFGVNIIYRTTRFISLHVFEMRRRNILKFVAGFIIIPALIVVIF